VSGRRRSRTVVHLSLVGLVAVSVVLLAGLGSAPRAWQAAWPAGLRLLAAAHAADRAADRATSPIRFGLDPQPQGASDETAPDRSQPRVAPSSAAGVPGPIDADAASLPAPPAQGAVEGSGQAAQAPPPPAAPPGVILEWPVPGGAISQPFHAGHLALDIAAGPGSAVVASEGGLVTFAGWRDNGGGLVVSIDHAGGITTVYNHLGSIWVAAGQTVARGQEIGGVGCTGICTGPHVHYEVLVGGVHVNPLRHL
jgi:murein DD-endopeptidase MepM/ murein hydrolase activator NlpD